MPPSPLVSILLPTYKRADYLAQAIPSALAQTHSQIELLILDDASPDHTPEVVRAFESDPRVRYVRQPRNLRLPGNWRVGLEMARGDYLCFLEDDDLLHPGFVECLLKPLLADPAICLSFCGHGVIRADGSRDDDATEKCSRDYGRDTLPRGPVREPARAALIHKSVNLTAALYRRRLLPPTVIDPAAQGAMDLWLIYQVLRNSSGGGIYYLPERLMDYRIHDSAMSNLAPLYVHEGMGYVYSHIADDDAFLSIRPEVRRKLQTYQTALGFTYLSESRFEEAQAAFARSRLCGMTLPVQIGSLMIRGGAIGAAATGAVRRFRQRFR